MKITEVRTLVLEEFPNFVWVEIHTDEGIIGTGETLFGVNAVVAYIHEDAARYLVGKDPEQIERHWRALYGYYLRFRGAGAETRGASALDLALWDIFAQAAGKPLYSVLGGRTRDKIRVYNTCAGYGYVRKPIVGQLDNKAFSNIAAKEGPYEDLEAFQSRPEELAASLIEEGFSAMKIWPFDRMAEPMDGQWIDPEGLEKGLEPFRRIREAVGMKIEVALEMHSRWNLTAAKRIARAVEPYEPMWYEDPLRIDNIDELAAFAGSTRIPTTASELVASKYGFRELLEKHVFGNIMFDFGWCGGITEARKIAAMADAYHLPVAPHDCTGPISLAVGVHFCVSQPNAHIQEMVRAYYSDWYPMLATELPRLDHGYLWPIEGAGIGTRIQPDIWKRKDASVVSTK